MCARVSARLLACRFQRPRRQTAHPTRGLPRVGRSGEARWPSQSWEWQVWVWRVWVGLQQGWSCWRGERARPRRLPWQALPACRARWPRQPMRSPHLRGHHWRVCLPLETLPGRTAQGVRASVRRRRWRRCLPTRCGGVDPRARAKAGVGAPVRLRQKASPLVLRCLRSRKRQPVRPMLQECLHGYWWRYRGHRQQQGIRQCR